MPSDWLRIGADKVPRRTGREDGEKALSHLVEIILVKLADERGKVGVLEETGKDDLCKLSHVLYDETVALSTPTNDGGKFWLGEHAGKGSA